MVSDAPADAPPAGAPQADADIYRTQVGGALSGTLHSTPAPYEQVYELRTIPAGREDGRKRRPRRESPRREPPRRNAPPPRARSGALTVIVAFEFVLFLVILLLITGAHAQTTPLAIGGELGDITLADVVPGPSVRGGRNAAKTLGERLGDVTGLTDSQSRGFWEEPFAITMLSEIIAGYVDDIASDTGDGAVSIDDAVLLLRKNGAYLENALDTRLYDDDYASYAAYLEDEGELEDLSLTHFDSNNHAMLSLLRLFLAGFMPYALIGLLVLLLVLLFFTNGRSGAYFLRSLGFSILLAGALMLIGGVVPELLGWPSESSAFLDLMVGLTLRGVLENGRSLYFIMCLGGVLLFVLGVIARSFSARRAGR